MNTPKDLTAVRTHMEEKARVRETLRQYARDAQHRSKRAIFAYHRGNATDAKNLLKEAEASLKKAREAIKPFPELLEAGMYREGIEEYVEARLYEGFLTSQKILPHRDEWGSVETYIGGLSDATGEVSRWALGRATERDLDGVGSAAEFINQTVEFFFSLDLTGHLRNKVDQAKKNLRTIEQIRYDLSLRQ